MILGDFENIQAAQQSEQSGFDDSKVCTPEDEHLLYLYKTEGEKSKACKFESTIKKELSDNSDSDRSYDTQSISHQTTGHMKSADNKMQNLLELSSTNRQVTTNGIDTPLHHAIRSLDTDKIRELLKADADFTAVNELGQTPLLVLDEAITKTVVKIIEYFFLENLPVVLSIEKLSMCHKAGEMQNLHLLAFLSYTKHVVLPENYYSNGIICTIQAQTNCKPRSLSSCTKQLLQL